jgi:hypothetical protein
MAGGRNKGCIIAGRERKYSEVMIQGLFLEINTIEIYANDRRGKSVHVLK